MTFRINLNGHCLRFIWKWNDILRYGETKLSNERQDMSKILEGFNWWDFIFILQHNQILLWGQWWHTLDKWCDRNWSLDKQCWASLEVDKFNTQHWRFKYTYYDCEIISSSPTMQLLWTHKILSLEKKSLYFPSEDSALPSTGKP